MTEHQGYFISYVVGGSGSGFSYGYRPITLEKTIGSLLTFKEIENINNFLGKSYPGQALVILNIVRIAPF